MIALVGWLWRLATWSRCVATLADGVRLYVLGWPGRALFHALGYRGITFAPGVYVRYQADVDDRSLLAHELCHVRQQRRDGWVFLVRYLWQAATRGYRAIDYEVEAREAEREVR